MNSESEELKTNFVHSGIENKKRIEFEEQSSPRKRRAIWVLIEGIIGAAKSTLAKILADHWTLSGLKVILISEPVKRWVDDGDLNDFYQDKNRYAYYFQTVAFIDKVKLLIQKYQEYGDDVDIYLCDRSIFSDPFFVDVLYQDGNMTNKEYKRYQEWWSMWSQIIPSAPDLFIYLDTSIEESLRRICSRNRGEETGISFEYQTKLKDKHDNFFGEKFVSLEDRQIPYLKVCGNSNFKDEIEEKNKIIELISEVVKPMLGLS